MKRIIYILVWLLCANSLHSQTNTCHSALNGYVLDQHDRSPLEFASVYISELKTGVLTDSLGFFVFTSLCDGIYHLKISHVNCDAIYATIEVIGMTSHTIYPEHHAHALKGVDIFTERKEQQAAAVVESLNAEQLQMSKGQSLGEALKQISGVNTLNTGNSISKPIIHGLHSNRILIINNGIRQEGQQWGADHAPEIDPFIATDITVVKGANSVRYGSDAMAGVIIIDTKKIRDSAGITGELNLVGMSNGKSGTASGFVEGNFAKCPPLSWRVQGTLKQSGTVWSPNYILANTAFKEQNFSYALAWKKPTFGLDVFYSQFNTDLGILSASHIGNLSDLQSAFTASVPAVTGYFTYKIDRPYQHVEHELFKTKSYLRTGNLGKLFLVYARQYNRRYEYDKYRPLNSATAALNKPELAFDITSHSIDLIWEHNQLKRLTGSIGISTLNQANTYQGRLLIPNFRNNTAGIFWIERWKKNKFTLEGGCRYDYKQLQVFKYADNYNPASGIIKPIHSFQNMSGNIGGIYTGDSAWSFAANVGTAWRAPSVSELYANGLHQGIAAIEYGNENLHTEIAYSAIAQLQYHSKKIMLQISPYLNAINGFIYRQPAGAPVLTIRGAFPAFYYTQTDALLKGCDAILQWQITPKISLTQKTGILRATNRSNHQWLISMPADRYETEIKIKYNKLHNGFVSASFLYVNKQWRVPANVDFALPPQAYSLVNINASYALKIKNQQLTMGFTIQNLLNETYRDYLDSFRYFADAMGRNFIARISLPFNSNFKKRLSPTTYEN